MAKKLLAATLLRRATLLRKATLIAFLGAAIGLACNSCTNQGGGSDGLGFEGTINGKILEQQSTRGSTADASTAQTLPSTIDTNNTCIRFQDLSGNALRGAKGEPIEEVPVAPDGTFSADGLPVGTDFTVCVDVGKDGSCELESCENIPSDGSGNAGRLDGAEVDPLTTIVLAKFRDLLADRGIDPGNLPISPVALVARVVDAYTHLFEESGIDHEITLADIETLSGRQLSDLFDAVIPAGARAGMQVVEGNLDLVLAADSGDAALAAAKVFLRAGFPIADGPRGLDLSSLGTLDGVETTTLSALFARGDPFREDFADVVEPINEPAQLEGEFFDVPVYVNMLAEPDRNFAEDKTAGERPPGPHLPVIHDYLLLKMAEMQLQGRRITLGGLYELLTNLDDGMGARLTYFVFDPNFFGPPLSVFQTADGRGKAIDLEALFASFFAEGFNDLTPEEMELKDAELRQLLRDMLADTIPPSLEQLAGSFMSERFAGINDLTSQIRGARAHLPFGRTGPSTFFVVADGDAFTTGSTVSPVTVNAEVTADGVVISVTYAPDGSGFYYLTFTEGTHEHGIAGLMVREVGRRLHGPHGPVRVDMNDVTLFAAVNGLPFIELVSETGNFYPGVNISIVSSDYVLEPTDPVLTDSIESTDTSLTETSDPILIEAAEFTTDGPNEQIFVLADSIFADAAAVRVDYDPATGTATYNPAARLLLQFLPDSHATGLFLLFNEETGRPAGDTDPVEFFEVAPPPPEDFETVFNDELETTTTDTVAPLEPVVEPAQLVATTDPALTDSTFVAPQWIIISAASVIGLPVAKENFTFVFGTEVPNARYNPDGDPYFDDINGDGVQGADEPTAPFRPTLFDPADWRSTDIRTYYRRSDNNGSVTFEEVDFQATVPRTLDGTALVPRRFVSRLNAFRFARPNSAINLLTAFLPPEFFDGTHGLTRETSVDVFGAIAIINLMMDQVLNVDADIDIDGAGPLPRERTRVQAHIFIAPVGDPFVLLLKGFAARTVIVSRTN